MNFQGEFINHGHCDVSQLAERLSNLPATVWEADAFRQRKFEVHQDTQTIKLLMDEDFRHTHPSVQPQFHQFLDLLEPILVQLRNLFDSSETAKELVANNYRPGYFIRIILVNLKSKGSIARHFDDYESLKRSHRIHLPIITNPKVLITVGDTTKHIKLGEIWEINNREHHWVNNESNQDRVHMILDYVLPGETVIDRDGATLTC